MSDTEIEQFSPKSPKIDIHQTSSLQTQEMTYRHFDFASFEFTEIPGNSQR